MTITYDTLQPGTRIEGPKFDVTRESIRAFCDGSLDYNPLHLDDDYMKGDFGKTNFGGIIMHGMNNFGLLTRMLTDWAYPAGGIQRRMETRWLKPVRPGDELAGRLEVLEVRPSRTRPDRGLARCRSEVVNQHGETVLSFVATIFFRRRAG